MCHKSKVLFIFISKRNVEKLRHRIINTGFQKVTNATWIPKLFPNINYAI